MQLNGVIIALINMYYISELVTEYSSVHFYNPPSYSLPLVFLVHFSFQYSWMTFYQRKHYMALPLITILKSTSFNRDGWFQSLKSAWDQINEDSISPIKCILAMWQCKNNDMVAKRKEDE